MKTAWIKNGTFQCYRMDKESDGVNYIPVISDIPNYNKDTETLLSAEVVIKDGVAIQKHKIVSKPNKLPTLEEKVDALLSGDQAKIDAIKSKVK